MAEQVDDRCTADRLTLFTNMGVHIKKPFPASQRQANNNKDYPYFQGDRVDAVDGRCTTNSDIHNVCCPLGLSLQTAIFIAVVFSTLTFLFSICSLVSVYYLSRINAVEVQGLREQVDRLDAQCGVIMHRSAFASHGSTDSAGAQSALGTNEFPWQQNTNFPTDPFAPGSLSHERANRRQNFDDGVRHYYEGDDDDEDEDENLPYVLFSAKSRQKRSAMGKNGKARKGKPSSRHCKKVEKCLKAKNGGGKVSRKCSKMLKCIPPPQDTGPKAVHFMSDFWKDRRQQKFGKEPCIFVKEWNATACRNRTVRIHQIKTPLHFYKEADWMAKVYKDKSQQPIVPLKDGGYNVTKSGLYLIYSSVMFHDIKPRQSQALVVNGEKRFKCMDSVDYIDKDVPPNQQHQTLAKYKTCTMTGVTHLSVGDRLEVQNLYAQTEIDLSTDATYFGAVLLSAGDINKSP